MTEISRLTPVPLKELWKHEAHDFNRWLAKNLDYLSDATGMTLSLVEQEASAGDFWADLLAEDEQGNQVVIECQLSKTDHDHLGKLLTYMSNLGAKIAIWVSSQPRPEHEKAIQWLNERATDEAFYLIQVEAFRIGDSPPAAKFTVIAGPTEISRIIGLHKKELAERHKLRLEFWQSLLERLEGKTTLHSKLKPKTDYWLSTGAGKTGLSYVYVILKDGARVELDISRSDAEINKSYFDQLHQHREEIEEAFGAPLDWQRADKNISSCICYQIPVKGGLKDRESWPRLQDAMIDAMIRLEKAFKPYIKKLRA